MESPKAFNFSGSIVEPEPARQHPLLLDEVSLAGYALITGDLGR